MATIKKTSKKNFRSLLTSIACALITCTNHHLIADEIWVSSVWQDLARTALLDYPQDDIASWQMRYNYLHSLCANL